MERNLTAIITIIILILTIGIYYYTNNLTEYPFVFKALTLFFIGYCSVYIVWLYKDFLDNSNLIYKTKKGGFVNIAKNEIPALGPYFSDLGLIIADKNKKFLFKKNAIGKYELPVINVENTTNPLDKIRKMFKDYVGKDLNLDDIISHSTYMVHRKDLSRYIYYHIYYVKYDIDKTDEYKMLSYNEIYSEFNPETSKGLFSQGTQFDINNMLEKNVFS